MLGEGGYKVVFRVDLWNGEKRALAVMDLQSLRQNGANNRGVSHRSHRSGAAGASRFAPLLALRFSFALSPIPAGLPHFSRFISASFQSSVDRVDRLFIRGNRGCDASRRGAGASERRSERRSDAQRVFPDGFVALRRQ